MQWKLKRWIPLCIWIIVIFGASSIPQLTDDRPSLPAGTDKVFHFIEYMVLAFCFYLGMKHGWSGKGLPLWATIFFTCMGIGALDEFYQGFIPGRDSSIMDFLADTAGVGLGVVLLYFRYGRSAGKVEAL